MVVCPECGGNRIYKDGNYLRYQTYIQRYKCATCGRRFIESDNVITNRVYNGPAEYALLKKAKNLDVVQEIKTCAEKGRQTPTENEIKATPQIEKLLAQLTYDGRAFGTVDNYRKAFARLLKEGADLFNPENTKSILAKSKMAQNAKRSYAAILNTWFDFIETKWKRPKYKRERKIPYIPTEKLLDELIAALGKKAAAYCQLLKETGARCGEISALTWDSIDSTQKTVNIVPEKDSNPRLLKLSQKALNMIANLPRNKDHIFADADDMRSCFFMQRRRIAKKLGNREILKVHFHSFRHWKATTEYHKTKDLVHVQEVLGHRNIEITRGYIYIEKALYKDNECGKFHTKVATKKDEIIQLLDAGFEYVMTKNDLAYFRKRK